jgi:hypothetical protein
LVAGLAAHQRPALVAQHQVLVVRPALVVHRLLDRSQQLPMVRKLFHWEFNQNFNLGKQEES